MVKYKLNILKDKLVKKISPYCEICKNLLTDKFSNTTFE